MISTKAQLLNLVEAGSVSTRAFEDIISELEDVWSRCFRAASEGGVGELYNSCGASSRSEHTPFCLSFLAPLTLGALSYAQPPTKSQELVMQWWYGQTQ